MNLSLMALTLALRNDFNKADASPIKVSMESDLFGMGPPATPEPASASVFFPEAPVASSTFTLSGSLSGEEGCESSPRTLATFTFSSFPNSFFTYGQSRRVWLRPEQKKHRFSFGLRVPCLNLHRSPLRQPLSDNQKRQSPLNSTPAALDSCAFPVAEVAVVDEAPKAAAFTNGTVVFPAPPIPPAPNACSSVSACSSSAKVLMESKLGLVSICNCCLHTDNRYAACAPDLAMASEARVKTPARMTGSGNITANS